MAKILLVEDDKSLREIYGVRLLAEGYDIVSAGDGEEALAMAIKERPHLIVSDVMMPKISGFDMLDILRSTTETKDIKVIMMTALSSEDQRLRGEQLGADRYLVKSQVGIEDVVRTVHEVLEDAPTAATKNVFAAPGVSAAPRPPSPTVPPRSEPALSGPQPVAPAPTPAPTPPPAAPAPTAPPQYVPISSTPTPPSAEPASASATPQPDPAPQAPTAAPTSFSSFSSPQTPASSGLPQPTAPFSTARPAGLADRIIQPLERAPEEGAPIADLMTKELGEADTSQAPEAPAAEPVRPPAPASTPPVPEDHGISFEETPSPSIDPPAQP